MTRRFLLAALLTVLGGAVTPSYADIVTVDFSGAVVPGGATSLDGLTVGDQYTASFTYDTTATALGTTPTESVYPIVGATLTDGATIFNFSGANPLSDLRIISSPIFGDQVQLDAYTSDSTQELQLLVTAPYSTVFSSTALPATLNLNDFPTVLADQFFDASANATADLSIPEPSSIALVCAGLISVGLIRRPKRKAA